MKTTINTGALELRGLYQRYVTEGLLMAGLLHFTMIGAYKIYSELTGNVTEFPTRFTSVAIDFFPPPPSLIDRVVLPNLTIASVEKPSVGTPIPVPDPEINREITIADQGQMNEILNASIKNTGTGTTEYIFDGTIIENEEVPPEFRIVEIDPKVVNRVNPIYPEIARRVGVEGTVLIKMWVTKEGKVKKSEIMNSTNELFDQAALDAAKQWTFTPAIMNNGPVDVWVKIPFKFKLNNRN